MIRGHPPYVAIDEAARKARSWGLIALVLGPGQNPPFHFILCEKPCVSFVRVRRLKYPRFAPAEIAVSCRRDIAEIRAMDIPQEIFRELWVRGSNRQWHRYLILADAIEELDGFDDDNQDPKVEEVSASSALNLFW
ncbi:MAG TPA: hypothetical protein PLO06_09725 [Methanoregulaceae archaeon]|nr:hypothetical protein [Methanoregulaceae archaeon]HPD76233.1 hypothetical protein [Methanoregulaceae archaeon]